VGNGVWSGPSLAPLLRECGVLAEAREVVFFGADIEQERKWPVGDREFSAPHGRSIFVQDALADGPMLALQFNGKPLPPDHGYPVRLVLPGWYGMTQVKWLNRILVLDRRYEGRHMARNYHSIQTAANGLVLETSISRNRLKSVVARVEGTAGKCRFSGAAWGGQYPIDQVQIRLDQQRWQNAAMSRTSHPHAWTLWEFDWHDAASGTHDIVSRAIDARGVIQPVRSEFISSREDNAQWPRRFVVAAAL
jgi:DMSO/TMAO reductase YedYZ molybdopterin-dependent catalytic subunit